MTLLARVATSQAALVARHTVLVCLDAVGLTLAIVAKLDKFGGNVEDAALLLPAQRQVGGRHNLDEVHVVVGLFVGLLFRIVERVEVVVGPSHILLANARDHLVRQLRSEAQVVHFVGESVLDALATGKVVLKIVDVHVTVAEGLARCEVEVSNHLVDTDTTFNTATFPPLLVEVLAVVFPLALLDVLTATE